MFGGIRFKRVKLYHGADGVLLYFASVAAIAELGNKFSNVALRMTVESGNGIGAKFTMLVLSHVTTRPFKMLLYKDLLPSNKCFPLKKLQFMLCKDDVTAISSAAELDHVRTKLSANRLPGKKYVH